MASNPLPTLADFPIPAGVAAAGAGWSPGMIEMAQHVGARATLLICERLGGREVYVPVDHRRSPFAEIVGDARARRLSRVYGREKIVIPMARVALGVAQRAAVIAMVRDGTISTSTAASITGLRRETVSKILSGTAEGVGVVAGELPVPRFIRLALDAVAISAEIMEEAGVPAAGIARMRAAIMDLVR